MVVVFTSTYLHNFCKMFVIYYLIDSKFLICYEAFELNFCLALRKYRNWEVPFELAIRRMKIEICIGGGSIADTLSHATHLVIASIPEFALDFDALLNR